MKSDNIKNLAMILSCITLALMLSVSSVAHAQRVDDPEKKGFTQGNHKGHFNEKGKRLGHKNERNPWYGSDDDTSGIDFDLTIHNHAIIPNVTFTATYNSLMTIQEVLTAVLGDSSDGFYFQECYEEFDLIQGTISDCTEGESAAPLDSNLTLEAAGLVEDPEVHLVYLP